jgi:hypothetical protein
MRLINLVRCLTCQRLVGLLGGWLEVEKAVVGLGGGHVCGVYHFTS